MPEVRDDLSSDKKLKKNERAFLLNLMDDLIAHTISTLSVHQVNMA